MVRTSCQSSQPPPPGHRHTVQARKPFKPLVRDRVPWAFPPVMPCSATNSSSEVTRPSSSLLVFSETLDTLLQNELKASSSSVYAVVQMGIKIHSSRWISLASVSNCPVADFRPWRNLLWPLLVLSRITIHHVGFHQLLYCTFKNSMQLHVICSVQFIIFCASHRNKTSPDPH